MSSEDPTDPEQDLGPALVAARSGAPAAAEALFPLVYAQLRRIAGGYFRGQTPGHTLQPTALVHEAFLRLVRQSPTSFADRTHFIAVAALAMRQILVEHARRRAAGKRGGAARPLTLEHPCAQFKVAGSPLSPGQQDLVELLAVDAALTRLQALSPRQARIVELQYFGGLTVEETAQVLAVSKSLVEKDWRRARAYLRSALAGETAASEP